MKNKLLLTWFCMLLSGASFATTQMITVADFSFSPSTVSIHLGDTVMFMWSSGSHTTTSTNVPVGAATWDNPMDATHTSFMYVPTVQGSYSYKCTPHASMGMTGSFTVLPPVAVTTPTPAIASISPNPANSVINIRFAETQNSVNVAMYNVIGKVVFSGTYTNVATVKMDVSAFDNGIYFLRSEQNGKAAIQKVVVSH